MGDPWISEHVVEDEDDGQRLDAWAAGRLFGLLTRNAVKKAIKRGEVLLDGEVAESSRRVRPGQTVRQLESRRPLPKVFPTEIPILWEDDHLAIVHKPAGLRVNGPQWRTLENALPHNLAPSSVPHALRIPRVAHRIDKPTRGLVLCAKTPDALIGLGWAFQRRQVHKAYLAIAVGRVDGAGSDVPLDDRAAHTEWSVVDTTRSLKVGWLSTVSLHPHTGRRHQLRRHLAIAGHPIVGDSAYTPGDLPLLKNKGLFLAAVGLQLNHPVTTEAIDVRLPTPGKFVSFLEREARRWASYHPAT